MTIPARVLLAHLLFDTDAQLAETAIARRRRGMASLSPRELARDDGRLLVLLREIRARDMDAGAVAIRCEIETRAPDLSALFWDVACVPSRDLVDVTALAALERLRSPAEGSPQGDDLLDVLASLARAA